MAEGGFLTPELMFRAANLAVLPGWFLVLVSPGSSRARVYCTGAICFVAVLYIVSLLNGGDVEGGSFFTLEGVINIFQRGNAFVATGCWLHYLALDLATGLSVAQDGLRHGFSRALMAPVLILILSFGPAGLLAHSLLKAVFPSKLPVRSTS